MKTLNLFVLFISIITLSQNQSKRISEYNLEKKVAIQSYDPVAYFKQGKAIKGKKDFIVSYQGIIYYFQNQENKDLFLKSPENYEPQYGGWCAFAMGDSGEKVEIDPETFKIIDNKLYLFYNAYFNNTLKKWNKNENDLKKKADMNWNKLIKSK